MLIVTDPDSERSIEAHAIAQVLGDLQRGVDLGLRVLADAPAVLHRQRVGVAVGRAVREGDGAAQDQCRPVPLSPTRLDPAQVEFGLRQQLVVAIPVVRPAVQVFTRQSVVPGLVGFDQGLDLADIGAVDHGVERQQRQDDQFEFGILQRGELLDHGYPGG